MKTLVAALAVVACAAATAWGDFGARLGTGRIVFWIETSENGVLDEQVLRFVASRAGMVVLDALPKGPANVYDYDRVVRRLHELQPALPVLLYTWASRRHDTGRMSSTILSGYPDLGPLLVRDERGHVVRQESGRLLFGDLRKKAYHEWLATRVKGALGATGADGVVLDVAVRTPSVMFGGKCKSEPGFCVDYARGMDSFFSTLRRTLEPRLVFYNGLWSLAPGMLEDQLKLLDPAHGVAVEYFGRNPRKEGSAFEADVLPYVRIMGRAPGKLFLVFGRGSWKYEDYEEDYRWQRYLYAAYLLGSGPTTLFKYHSSFQMPPHAGRSGALDWYACWDLELGSPLAPYETSGGLYLRRFEKGIVLLAPHGARDVRYHLATRMFTAEGEPMQGSLEVRSGEALLLLTERREPPAPLRLRFDDQWVPIASHRGAKVARESDGNRFLRLESAGRDFEWEHDIMLDPVRSLGPPSGLKLRARTSDPRAAIKLVAEVDDARRAETHVVVLLTAQGASEEAEATCDFSPFRTGRVPYRRGVAPCVRMGATLSADGHWHSITLDGAERINKTRRYTFRRWSFLRVLGTTDLDDIELHPKP